ncbi:MAG: tetratricopeptide repeat protein, partial [Candidatus Zixiibacteriota bacterium]
MRDRETLLKRARLGNRNVQFELACNYYHYAPKDRRRAVYWYRKSASQGHAEAQYYLADCLAYGIGVRKSKREAVRWLMQAA